MRCVLDKFHHFFSFRKGQLLPAQAGKVGQATLFKGLDADAAQASKQIRPEDACRTLVPGPDHLLQHEGAEGFPIDQSPINVDENSAVQEWLPDPQ